MAKIESRINLKLLKAFFGVLLAVVLYIQISAQLELWHFKDLNKVTENGGILILLFVLLLSVLIWIIEGLRWRQLVEDLEELQLPMAVKSVLAGNALGTVTPGRGLQFGAKVLFLKKKNWAAAALRSIEGSMAQWFTWALFALLALAYLNPADIQLERFEVNLLSLFAGLASLMCVYLYFQFASVNKLVGQVRPTETFGELVEQGAKGKWVVLGLSMLKGMISIFQYYLIFYAFGVDLSIVLVLSLVAIIFFIQALVPSSIIIDLPLRANLAVLLFSLHISEISILVIAPGLLWLLNLALPAIPGYFFLSTVKKESLD